MSRPKQCDYENSAKGKIEAAFWTVLEKEGFHSVTMLRLAQKSGLNRNTVYYHFGNVQEVSRFVFHNSFSHEASKRFIGILLSGAALTSSDFQDADLLSHIQKIQLFARSESPLLIGIVKETLKSAWFASVGIAEEKLTESDIMQTEFIVSGLISIIGNNRFAKDFSMLKAFPDTLIGKAAINTLKRIADKQQ